MKNIKRKISAILLCCFLFAAVFAASGMIGNKKISAFGQVFAQLPSGITYLRWTGTTYPMFG